MKYSRPDDYYDLGYRVYDYPFTNINDKIYYDGYITEPKYSFTGIKTIYEYAEVRWKDGTVETKYLQRRVENPQETITHADFASYNCKGYDLDLRTSDINWKNKRYELIFKKDMTFDSHYLAAIYALCKDDIVISSRHVLNRLWHRADFHKYPFLEPIIYGYNSNDHNYYRIIPVDEAIDTSWNNKDVVRQINRYRTDLQKINLAVGKINRWKDYKTIYELRDDIDKHYKDLSWEDFQSSQIKTEVASVS